MHVAANGKMSYFLWLSSIPLCVCVCVYIYTTYSLAIDHLMDTEVASYLDNCK